MLTEEVLQCSTEELLHCSREKVLTAVTFVKHHLGKVIFEDVEHINLICRTAGTDLTVHSHSNTGRSEMKSSQNVSSGLNKKSY